VFFFLKFYEIQRFSPNAKIPAGPPGLAKMIFYGLGVENRTALDRPKRAKWVKRTEHILLSGPFSAADLVFTQTAWKSGRQSFNMVD
jgi:hypothetical protein